jgi:hypothetical protein
MCARIDDAITYGAPLFEPYNLSRLYEFDSLGRRGKPNARYKKWKLNSLGYRGPELREDTTRIVVFGASETFGLFEREDREYPRLLEKRLNERAGSEQFQVVNVAYAGMPVDAMIRRVPEITKKVRPRIALIYPTPANYIWLPWLKSETAARGEEAPNKLEIRIIEQIKEILKRTIPEETQHWLRKRQILQAVHAYGQVMERVPEQNVARFRSDLEALTEALQSHGVDPVLVTHAHRFGPTLTEEDRYYLVVWRRFYPMLSEAGFVDMEHRMNAAVRSLASARGYLLIDAARRMQPGSRYFADFAHFTDDGSEAMSNVLAEGLSPKLKNCCAASVHVAAYWRR